MGRGALDIWEGGWKDGGWNGGNWGGGGKIEKNGKERLGNPKASVPRENQNPQSGCLG